MSSKHHEPRDAQKKPEEGVAAIEPSGDEAPGAELREGEAPADEASSIATSSEARIAKAELRVAELEAQAIALKEELSSVNDKYLRKLAEEANFRKRMARDKEDGQRFAVAALLGDIIPVLDDFDRAVASAETARDYAVLHDGIVLIRRQLGQILENKYGLRRFESLGKPFDPNAHEAVAMEPGGSKDEEPAPGGRPGAGCPARSPRRGRRCGSPMIREERRS
jgi:molecular chaperone GrpE